MRTLEEILSAVADPARPLIRERVAIVVAHPDDETLGLGALLPRLADVTLVHVTDGAPRGGEDARRHGFPSPEDYAAARHRELAAATGLAGVPAGRLTCLGVPDQGAASCLAETARRLVPLIRDVGIVLTHALEGGHPDHDATAFAVHAASRMIGQSSGACIETQALPAPWHDAVKDVRPRHAEELLSGEARGGVPTHARGPVLVEFPLYRLGPEGGWLRQSFADESGAAVLRLTQPERDLKRRMIAAHATQRETLEGFGAADEWFRPAPDHDFTMLPNGGALLYERHGWGLTGARWRELAAAALAGLGLSR